MKAQAAAETRRNKLQADFQMKQMELQQAIQLAQMQLANDRAIAQQSWNLKRNKPTSKCKSTSSKQSAKRRWRAKPN